MADKLKELTVQHYTAIDRLLNGESPESIARSMGIWNFQHNPVNDWMRDPLFRDEYILTRDARLGLRKAAKT